MIKQVKSTCNSHWFILILISTIVDLTATCSCFHVKFSIENNSIKAMKKDEPSKGRKEEECLWTIKVKLCSFWERNWVSGGTERGSSLAYTLSINFMAHSFDIYAFSIFLWVYIIIFCVIRCVHILYYTCLLNFFFK